MQDVKMFGKRIENLEDVTLGIVSLSVLKTKYISEKKDKWHVSKFNLVNLFFCKRHCQEIEKTGEHVCKPHI